MKYSYFQGYSLRSELLVGIVSSTAGTHEVGPVEHLRLQFPESRPLALWSLRDVGPLVGTLDVLDKKHKIIRNYLMTYIAWIGQCQVSAQIILELILVPPCPTKQALNYK